MPNSSTAESLIAVGLMSGTSVDGIDAAVVRVAGSGSGIRVQVIFAATYGYPQAVRDRVFGLSDQEGVSAGELSAMNFLLGKLFGEAALSAIRAAGLRIEEVDLVASHGQTIWHDPRGCDIADRSVRSTLQIGEPSVIAERTGITVVADFRPADMAAGGQGAPLVPYADFVLLRDPKVTRTVQNIGGIANLTYLPAGCDMSDILAFDTGPGNMLIDHAAKRLAGRPFDAGGEAAARGDVDDTLLAELMSHPFFEKPPPKSTGREEFGEQFLDAILQGPAAGKRAEDVMATLTAFTARTIADQHRRWLPEMPSEVILGGGGMRNRTLRRMLEEVLSPARIRAHEEFGIPSDAKEAVAFALLGCETIRGVPSNVPAATGAKAPAILGKICPGRNWAWLLEKLNV